MGNIDISRNFMDILRNVSANIKSLRKRLGKTQEEFAKMIGISRSYLGMIENGGNSPTLEIVISIITHTDESLYSLLGLPNEDLINHKKEYQELVNERNKIAQTLDAIIKLLEIKGITLDSLLELDPKLGTRKNMKDAKLREF